MKKILLLLLAFNVSYGQSYLKLSAIERSASSGSVLISTGSPAILTYTPTLPVTKITGISATSPLFYNSGTFTIQPSSTSQNGALSSTDWNTFNDKQSRSTSVSAYTISGIGTPSVTLIVSGKIRNPTTGVITTLTNQTFSNQAVTHFTNTGVTYMGVKEDLTLTMQSGRFTTAQRYNHLTAWVIIYNTTAPFNIIAFNEYPATTDQVGQQLHSFMRNAGAKVISGGQYSGIGVAGLHLQRGGSIVQDVGWGSLTADNPNEKTLAALTSTITFDVRMSTGTYTTNQTVINPAIYEVSSGSVIAVPNPGGNVTVYRLTFFNSNLTRVQMGQTVYSDIDEAIARTVAKSDAYVTETNIADNGITSTFLAIQKNCTDWTQTTRYRFFPTPESGAGFSPSFATLQSSYDIASQPQLRINDTKGAIQFMSARASNTLSTIEGLNIAGTTTFSLTGDGDVTANKLTLTSVANQTKSANAASSSTVDLSAVTGNFLHITGTTTINNLGTVQAGAERTLVFDGALTLTYNATSLILPGAASILTAANDVAVFRSEGSGNWRCVSYVKSDEAYTAYVPTLTGNSTDPTLISARWKMLTRNTCHVIITFGAVGTSNATTKTITLPFNASATSIQHMVASGLDNNTGTLMNVRTRVSSNVADIFRLFSLGHTASGNWTCCLDIVYQID